MLKACKYQIYPSHIQAILIKKHIGGCRFAYNWSLKRKVERYEKDGTILSCYDLNILLPGLKKEYPWLSEINSQSLQQANKNLDTAFRKFHQKNCGFPKFKSKKHPVQSFQIPQYYQINLKQGYIKLPKIGEVHAKIHKQSLGVMKVATVLMTQTGKFFISVTFDDGKNLPKKVPYDEKTIIGVDVGLKHYAIFSNGTKIENPRNLRKSLSLLRYHQRKLNRKVKGSGNYKKCKYRVAKLHEKVANQRQDFQHKLSTKIVRENQAVAVETLNISGMLKNHYLALSISDAAWKRFLKMLKYKCNWNGKTFLPIDQFEPTSKTCHVCGYYNRGLTLNMREWGCPQCGTHHDRDENAAINIKQFALKKQIIGTGPERPGEPADSGTLIPGMTQETHKLG